MKQRFINFINTSLLDIFTIFFSIFTIYSNVLSFKHSQWMTFTTYVAIPILIMIGTFYLLKEPRLINTPHEDLRNLSLQKKNGAFFSFIAIALTLVTCLFTHRPDADDNYYLNLIVSMLDNPSYRIFAEDSILRENGLNILLPAYKVTSYEIFIALMAQTFKIDHRVLYYLITPTLLSLIALTAYFQFFDYFLKGHLKHIAVLITIILTISWGDTHLAYGNRMLIRLFQGKGTLLFLFVPLIFIYGFRFIEMPTWRSWLKLFLIQIAAVGFSSSALVVAPYAAGISILTFTFANRKPIKNIPIGVLSSIYLVFIGLTLSGQSSDYSSIGTLAGIFSSLGNQFHIFLTIAFCSIGLFYIPDISSRRLYALMCFFIVLLVFNPLTANFISTYVARNMSWRLAWSAPVPAIMAIGITGILARPKIASKIVGLFLIFLFIYVGQSTVSAKNGVTYGWFNLKVPPEYYSAEKISKFILPNQLLLAPHHISIWIPTFHNHPRQLVSRQDELIYTLGINKIEEYKARIRLQQTIDGVLTHDSDLSFLFEQIRVREIDAIVLHRDAPNTNKIIRTLANINFSMKTTIDGEYMLYFHSK